MKLYTLAESQRLPVDLTTAWAFFSNPANLARITPPRLGFEVVSSLPPAVYSGLFITYKVSPLAGIPVTWVTEITNVDKPNRFVDEQRVGPYRIWHHEHQFIEIEGGVEMRDQVTYALPYGILGRAVHALIVKNSLQEIFGFRRKVLAELFGTL